MDLQSDPIEVSDETESAIREYHTNGASVIRGILDQKWISTMREAIQRVLDHPEAHPWNTLRREKKAVTMEISSSGAVIPILKNSCVIPLASNRSKVLKSNSIRFFYDQLLVKEPLTKEKTPFHQDLPYWPLKEKTSSPSGSLLIVSDFNRRSTFSQGIPSMETALCSHSLWERQWFCRNLRKNGLGTTSGF